MQPYLRKVGCSLTLTDVANYHLRTSICGGITPLNNSTELATHTVNGTQAAQIQES
jgi:hypothetical protein